MSIILLIPAPLHEEGLASLPSYLLDQIKSCDAFFVENERTTRRYFKQLDKSIVIDAYTWSTMGTQDSVSLFKKLVKDKKIIGLVSEAGCPGVADPGQELIALAHEMECTIRPLVGPSSILLALMASGLNGQQFRFNGYLPIEEKARQKAITDLEQASRKDNCTQLFIETPYRNNTLLSALLKYLSANTRLCIAADLTGPNEWITTKAVSQWRQSPPELHKRQVIFAFKTL
ncbi:MAG: SAM-dependent methyltransferase [Chitinophagaceae bacterium]